MKVREKVENEVPTGIGRSEDDSAQQRYIVKEHKAVTQSAGSGGLGSECFG